MTGASVTKLNFEYSMRFWTYFDDSASAAAAVKGFCVNLPWYA